MFKFILLTLFCLNAYGQANTTPNMLLPAPIPGVTPGPEWAQDVYTSLFQIDSHNHSTGQGVQIQPNGLNISSDLTMLGNNLTTTKSIIFSPQASPLANSAPYTGAIYVSGNDLYYNDVSGGHQVKLTSNGTVNATSSGIQSGTATASFSAGTLVILSNVNVPANVQAGSYQFGNAASYPYYVTVAPPASITAPGYSLTLPTIPASLSFLTLDTSGNISASVSETGGITNSMLFGNINTSKLFPGDQVGIATTSQSADYTAVPSIGQIRYNTASAHTLTLYSAAANPGYRVMVQKLTNDFNALTIATFGSEKINGASTTSINTQYETITLSSDGANWIITNRTYPTSRFAVTFTASGGISAIGAQNSWARRVGNSLEVQLVFTGMTVAASAAVITMPSGLTIDTSTIESRKTILGWYSRMNNNGQIYASTNSGVVTNDTSSDTNLVISFQNTAVTNPTFASFTMNSFFVTNDGLSAFFTVPIAGWN